MVGNLRGRPHANPTTTLYEAPIAPTHHASSSLTATAPITNAKNTIGASSTSEADVLLKTATVLLCGPNETIQILCFFDNVGSQKSFIKKSSIWKSHSQENLIFAIFFFVNRILNLCVQVYRRDNNVAD